MCALMCGCRPCSTEVLPLRRVVCLGGVSLGRPLLPRAVCLGLILLPISLGLLPVLGLYCALLPILTLLPVLRLPLALLPVLRLARGLLPVLRLPLALLPVLRLALALLPVLALALLPVRLRIPLGLTVSLLRHLPSLL